MSQESIITINIGLIVDESGNPLTAIGAVFGTSEKQMELAQFLARIATFYRDILMWFFGLYETIPDFEMFSKSVDWLQEGIKKYMEQEDTNLKPFADFLDNLDLSNPDGEQ